MFVDGYVEENVSFGTEPKPKSKREWNYSLVEVKESRLRTNSSDLSIDYKTFKTSSP
jgi:hypothetical protein